MFVLPNLVILIIPSVQLDQLFGVTFDKAFSKLSESLVDMFEIKLFIAGFPKSNLTFLFEKFSFNLFFLKFDNLLAIVGSRLTNKFIHFFKFCINTPTTIRSVVGSVVELELEVLSVPKNSSSFI